MIKTVRSLMAVGMIFLIASPLLAHDPAKMYINQKSVSAVLQDKVEASISYYSPPADETHIKAVKTGDFTQWFAELSFSGDLKMKNGTIPAGKYTVGAIKNSDSDWTMALYPGKIARGETPDLSKAIKLDSMFSKSDGMSPNVSFDFNVGHGKLGGRYVLTWRYGSLSLAGARS